MELRMAGVGRLSSKEGADSGQGKPPGGGHHRQARLERGHPPLPQRHPGSTQTRRLGHRDSLDTGPLRCRKERGEPRQTWESKFQKCGDLKQLVHRQIESHHGEPDMGLQSAKHGAEEITQEGGFMRTYHCLKLRQTPYLTTLQ